MSNKQFSMILAIGAFLFGTSVSAYVLLSPERTWANPPTYIIDDRGQATITDSDGGVSATVDAINASTSWNGAGSGTVVTAVAGDVSGFTLGDNIPMLNFEDPTGQCDGTCLAATFTGFCALASVLACFFCCAWARLSSQATTQSGVVALGTSAGELAAMSRRPSACLQGNLRLGQLHLDARSASATWVW